MHGEEAVTPEERLMELIRECRKPEADSFDLPECAPSFEDEAQSIGRLVDSKNVAYGHSFDKTGAVLELLYPDGLGTDAYGRVLFLARVIDKLFRLATDAGAFGEDPLKDIVGYCLLELRRVGSVK